MLLYSVCLRARRKLGLKRRVCRVWQKDKLVLTIHDTSHFSKENAAMCHGANKIQKDKYSKKTKDEYVECQRVSIDVSLDVSNVEGSRMSKGFVGWDVVFQAYYSPLLVLVCRSVSQDPPGRLKTSLSCRSFILSVDCAQPISGRVCARGIWPTNQRLPLARHRCSASDKRSIVRLA